MPPCPRGFKVRIWQPSPDPGPIISPLWVYAGVIAFLHRHSADAWTGLAVDHTFNQGHRLAVKIQAVGERVLTNGQVKLALHDGVSSMSEMRSFYITKIEISLLGRSIGEIWMVPLDPPVPASISAANVTAQTAADELEGFFAGTLSTNAVVPDSGRYIDPDLPSLAIDYTFSNRRVKAADVLTCIMQALLIISYDGAVDFEYLNAVVPNLALNIHATTAPDGLPKQADISLYQWNLALFFLAVRRWDELDFVVSNTLTVTDKRVKGFFLRV